MGKLKNRKGEMIKGDGDIVIDWISRQCNIAIEKGLVHKDWKSTVNFPLYKGKDERTECNYRGISLSVVGKIYTGILVGKVCRVTERFD